jgi:predicted dehydrogenase
MPHKYTAAVIGVGKAGGGEPKGGGHAIGYTHAKMFQSNPRIDLAAGVDINPQNLAAFQEKFSVARGFASHETMLRELKPDLVSIGTYVGLHATMIIAAARAGVKGILCEKPFLASPVECETISELVVETGVKIIVAHVRRYRPAFRRARDLLDSGAIGQPIAFLSGIADWDLSEWGSHWLDMFRFLNHDRQVEWVFGQARVRNLRGYGHAMEDHAVAYFQFDNGIKGILDGGHPMNGGGDMTLIGTNGTLRIADENKLTLTNHDGQKTESFGDDAGQGWDACWTAALSDLITWIESGPEPEIGLTNMLKTSELNLAAYLSAVRGDRIDLPLDDQTEEWPVEELARRAARAESGPD